MAKGSGSGGGRSAGGGSVVEKTLPQKIQSFSALSQDEKELVGKEILASVEGKSAEYEYGTRSMTATVSGTRIWEREDRSRLYFDIKTKDKFKAPSNIYLDISGNGRTSSNGGSFSSRLGTIFYDHPYGGSGAKNSSIDSAIKQIFG